MKKVKFYPKTLVVILTLLLLLSNNSFAGETINIVGKQETTIKSDIINIKRRSQTIDFVGNVVIERGDDSMLSSNMTVFYEKITADKRNRDISSNAKIKTIIAKDNVKIFSKEFVASAINGSFDPNKNIFILEDNVIVNKGSSTATGEKFIYNLTTKKGRFAGKDKITTSKNTNDTRAVVVIGNEDFKKDNENSKR